MTERTKSAGPDETIVRPERAQTVRRLHPLLRGRDRQRERIKTTGDAFLADAAQKKTVLLELGVGYNTPTIICFPFERLTNRRKETCLIRVNADFPEALPENAGKTVSFPEDIATVLADLQQNNAPRG